MNESIGQITEVNKAIHALLGKCWHEFNNDCVCQKPGCCADNSFGNRNPDYCSDIAACFALDGPVEWLRAKWLRQNPDETEFFKFIDCCEHGWRVNIEWGHHDGDIEVSHAVHKSLPTAICLAILNQR